MSRLDELPKTPRKSVNWDTMDIEDCATSYAKAHPKPKESSAQRLQFVMKCVGFAVGAGNIWRFPSMAYEHGGGAFVVAYLICSVFCGLPMMYLEVLLGQYLQAPPTTVFYRLMPVIQGVGWTMCGITFLVCVYYNVVLSWMAIYLFDVISGRSSEWSNCDRMESNCVQVKDSLECSASLFSKSLFINGSCSSDILGNRQLTPSTEQYFQKQILETSESMDNLGDLNMAMVLSLVLLWSLIIICLFADEKFVRSVTWIAGLAPLFIIGVLCLRAVLLPGASLGLRFYFQDDLRMMLDYKTWRAAFSQTLYSLSVGFGTLITISSTNRNDHKCLRDVSVIFFMDALISILGGIIVFSTLGYMANAMDLEVQDVLTSGTSACFVAYPEVFATLPLPFIWAFVFFFTIILLGIATQIVYIRTIVTSILDQFSLDKQSQPMVQFVVCATALGCGTALCSKSGIYYFELLDEYSTAFSLSLVILIEVVVVVLCYGIKHHLFDIRSVFGSPTSTLEKTFGSSGYFFTFCWVVVVPVLSLGILISNCVKEPILEERGRSGFRYPEWSKYIGWSISFLPSLFIPISFLVNLLKFLIRGRPLSELFRVQPGHRSYWKTRGRGTPKINPDVSNKKSFIAL